MTCLGTVGRTHQIFQLYVEKVTNGARCLMVNRLFAGEERSRDDAVRGSAGVLVGKTAMMLQEALPVEDFP